MYLPELTLHEPASLRDAAAALRRLGPSARLMAGGTDLLVDLKTGRVRAEHIVSIARIPELRGISRVACDGPPGNGRAGAAALRIGALTTINELDRSTALDGPYSALRDATREMAATQVRNLATVGGNLASAVPCADLPPILMVMGARVVLWTIAGERTLPLEAFFLGPRHTVMGEGELLTSIIVPQPSAGFGAAYARLALREANSVAVAGVAASLTLGRGCTITSARLALSAVAPIPKLVPAASATLIGRKLADAIGDAAAAAAEAAEPISDVRGSAGYRRELVGTLARRALFTAAARARETGP